MDSYSFSNVQSVDLSHAYRYVEWHENCEFFKKEQGEHYKLLSSLASQVPSGSTAIDIGTYCGYSAVALASSNRDIKVITYDIVDLLPRNAVTARNLPNIERRIGDCMRDFAIPGFLDKVKLIVLDVDPHDGVQERMMIDSLIQGGYRNVVVMDDIHLNEEMKDLWEWAKDKPGMQSRDVTEIGHWSGSGFLDFADAR